MCAICVSGKFGLPYLAKAQKAQEHTTHSYQWMQYLGFLLSAQMLMHAVVGGGGGGSIALRSIII